ncbi:MAG: 50S ribosomal protein L23, partial [Rhabdochlamydiaceae bacterium]
WRSAMSNTIIRPIITEQSMAEAEKGRYSFIVSYASTKPMIRQAVKDRFNVDIVNVMTIISKGKTKRVGKTRQKMVMEPFKKAIVQLKEGQKIALFELGA